jgi:4-amino-4-deoxy-L-arabinose transferase-like glycosyltransferase
VTRHPDFLLILFAATAIRFFGVGGPGAWWDEMLSVNEAVGSVLDRPLPASDFSQTDLRRDDTLAGVTDAVIQQDGGNTVLYAMALHFWTRCFGPQDRAARSLSVVCGVLVVLFGARLAAVTIDRRAARWAALILALQPLLVRYSREARAYSLATLLALLATLCFVRVVGLDPRGERRGLWALYGVLGAAAFLSHYLSAGVLLAHASFALLKTRSRRVWMRLVAAAALVGLLGCGWMLAGGAEGLRKIKHHNAEYARRAGAAAGPEFARRATAGEMAAGALQLTYVMTGNGLQDAGLRLREMMPLLVPPAILLWMGWARCRRLPEPAPSAALLLVVLSASAIGVGTGLALISGHTVSFQTLYANFASPYSSILLGVGAAEASRRSVLTRGVLAVQLAVMLLSLGMVYEDAPRFRLPNSYAAVAGQMPAMYQRGDRVVYSRWPDARRVNLYLPALPPMAQAVVAGPPGLIRVEGSGGEVRFLALVR